MSSQEQSPKGRDIPAIRRVVLNDVSQLPSDYSSTPGGTLFSTTPGATICKGKDDVVVVHSDQDEQRPTDAAEGNYFATSIWNLICTRIVYDRSRLMQLRNSPLARSPPANMAKIPGITDFNADSTSPKIKNKENGLAEEKDHIKEDTKYGHDEHPQFEMDI